MSDDAMARIDLPDRRSVWRDGRGRYRDVRTGRWVQKSDVYDPPIPQMSTGRRRAGLGDFGRVHVEKEMLAVMRGQGYPAETFDEVWARILGVQAQIALDRENGNKATSAARLLAQATGLMDRKKADEQPEPWFVLGRELALEVLAMVEAEQARRGIAVR